MSIGCAKVNRIVGESAIFKIREPDVGSAGKPPDSFDIPPGPLALLAARFNSDVVERLVAGARQALREHQVPEPDVELFWVPGAFEIPLLARKLADSGKYLAVIALGCVIRGETDHYDHICSSVSQGVARVALDSGVPVIFGVLTCETREQALERAGGRVGNKGYDAALAALEMITLIRKLER
jgi:6,7-dimethyl-8-ribityllumazine synthase